MRTLTREVRRLGSFGEIVGLRVRCVSSRIGILKDVLRIVFVKCVGV